MPGFHRLGSLSRYDPHEREGSENVPEAGQDKACDDKQYPGHQAQPGKFAEEESRHDARLNRSNATACFIHSDPGVSQVDDVANLSSRNCAPIENFNRNSRVEPHHYLHKLRFKAGRPRNGDEKEIDRKGEMKSPRPSAALINSEQGQNDRTNREAPTQGTPIGTGRRSQNQREEGRTEDQGDGSAQARPARRFCCRSIRPAQKEKV